MTAAAAKVARFLPGDGSPWLWHLNSERPFIKVTRRHRRRLPPSHSLLSQRVGLGELGRRASVRPSAQPGAAAAGTTAVRIESTERPPEGAAPAWIEGPRACRFLFLGPLELWDGNPSEVYLSWFPTPTFLSNGWQKE